MHPGTISTGIVSNHFIYRARQNERKCSLCPMRSKTANVFFFKLFKTLKQNFHKDIVAKYYYYYVDLNVKVVFMNFHFTKLSANELLNNSVSFCILLNKCESSHINWNRVLILGCAEKNIYFVSVSIDATWLVKVLRAFVFFLISDFQTPCSLLWLKMGILWVGEGVGWVSSLSEG